MNDRSLVTFVHRIVIFAGAYGSGKTEVAVNYAIQTARVIQKPVSIIDLDIVNPYFRSREAAVELESCGVQAIMPLGEHCHADLPIIVPQVRAAIEEMSNERLIIDVGGDDLGARVLGSLSDALGEAGYEFLLVLNANRPFTANVEGTKRMIQAIESSSRLHFTGIVSNTHLIGETTPQIILDGIKLANEVSAATELPVVFAAGMDEVLDKLDAGATAIPLLSLSRRMLKPWELKEALRKN